MDELLDGVDVLLLAAGRYDGLREAFLCDMGNTPRSASIPVIAISWSLKQALLDQKVMSLSWHILLRGAHLADPSRLEEEKGGDENRDNPGRRREFPDGNPS